MGFGLIHLPSSQLFIIWLFVTHITFNVLLKSVLLNWFVPSRQSKVIMYIIYTCTWVKIKTDSNAYYHPTKPIGYHLWKLVVKSSIRRRTDHRVVVKTSWLSAFVIITRRSRYSNLGDAWSTTYHGSLAQRRHYDTLLTLDSVQFSGRVNRTMSANPGVRHEVVGVISATRRGIDVCLQGSYELFIRAWRAIVYY